MAKSESGFNTACRDSGKCNHAKHGWTRKDHAPSKPRVKAQGQPMAGWDHSVCWCLVKQPTVTEA